MSTSSIAIIANQAFSLINFRGPLIRDLVAHGMRVYALAPDFDDSLRKELQMMGAEPVDFSLARTGVNPLRDLSDMFRLFIVLLRLKPDVTLAYSIKPVIYGTLAAWLSRIPKRVTMIEGLGYVFTDSDAPPSWQRNSIHHVVKYLFKIALAKADKIIFLNPDDLSEFANKKLVAKDKAIVLGGIGVDLEEWQMAPPVTKPITFLLAARLLREKGIFDFVEASRRIRTHYPEVRFILLGGLDSNPGAIQQAEIECWVNEGLLEWPGHVPMQPWLAKASVFVLPSYREGVPRSTQEAMAMGRPIISTNVPGCRETVTEGLNGYLVPVRNPEALMQRMLQFIKYPHQIVTMGMASRKLAEERFDVRKVNLRLQALLCDKELR